MNTNMISLKCKDPEFINHRARAAISTYLLEHFMEPKKIEFLENLYGGKIVAQRSAKIIQRYFRWYKDKKLKRPITSDLPPLLPMVSIDSSINNDNLSEISADSDEISYDEVDDPFDIKKDPERKRLHTLGKNIFNRNCNQGINFLIKHDIIKEDPESVLWLLNSNDISLYAKGEYLSQTRDSLAVATRKEYLGRMSFQDCSIEKGMRKLFSQVRIPGENQNLLNIVEEFACSYLLQNPHLVCKIKNENTIILIAYGILMLHTSIHNKSASKKGKMTKEDFISLFKTIYQEEYINCTYLDELYENVKRKEMTTKSDLTDNVRNVFMSLVGRVPKDLIQNHRKFVCEYTRLFEIQQPDRRPDSHAHSRVVYLFNDLLLVTKVGQKKGTYQVKHVIPLSGLQTELFTTEYYLHGLKLTETNHRNKVTYLHSKEQWVRDKLRSDLEIYIDEICQLEAYFAEENA